MVWTAARTGTKRCARRGVWAQVAVWRRALTLLVEATCTSIVNRTFEIKKSEFLMAVWHRVVWHTGTHLLHKELSKGHATMYLSKRGHGHDRKPTVTDLFVSLFLLPSSPFNFFLSSPQSFLSFLPYILPPLYAFKYRFFHCFNLFSDSCTSSFHPS